jgi:hypothetical protein
MQSFLKSYIQFHFKNFQNETSTIVLPSKRAVSFLKREFASQKQAVWLPEIIDILELIERVSKLEIIGNQDTLLLLYKTYLELGLQENPDSYTGFSNWASPLLSDFNEIDRFLVDVNPFFKYHKELKELTYFGEKKTDFIKSYIQFWEDMPKLYFAFKTKLLDHKLAYQGLAYRRAVENIKSYIETNKKQHIFLGFNAMNKAEEQLVECFLNSERGKVVWDIDSFYLKENKHPAKLFISKYRKLWDRYKKDLVLFENKNFEEPKDIHFVASTKSVGQSKSLLNILNSLNEKQLNNTAIVLNDEHLLTPVLNSIPDHIKNVNITMGLPLRNSPIADFFNTIITHQKIAKDSIFKEDLVNLYSHAALSAQKNIKNEILKQDILYFTFDDIKNSSFYPELLFADCLKIYSSPVGFVLALLNLTDLLKESVVSDLQPYLRAYKNVFYKLNILAGENPKLNTLDICTLFFDLENEEKLSFKGSQTKGLQIMGMLETRLLDFENIILLSVNEGILPTGKSDNSYITYGQKMYYNLPTHKDKDAIYAYHFFRLLQRSKKCFILYDNDQSGLNKGELSRFAKYLQIFQHANHQYNYDSFSLTTKSDTKEDIVIEKTEKVMEKLLQISKSGFSPTSLTTYIDNPIKFYKRYVLDVKEEENFEEEINFRDFGKVVHDTLEEMYKNTGEELSKDVIKSFHAQKEILIQKHFDRNFTKDAHLYGSNRLRYEIALASVSKFLNMEQRSLYNTSLNVIEVEKKMSTTISTKNHTVTLKGQIDRVDNCNGTLRIIDYKTGYVNTSDLNIKEWQDVISDYKYSKVFQTLFYALMFAKNNTTKELQAGIISLKNLDKWFMPVKKGNQTLVDETILEEFQDILCELLEEILDPKIPFTEKESLFES